MKTQIYNYYWTCVVKLIERYIVSVLKLYNLLIIGHECYDWLETEYTKFDD